MRRPDDAGDRSRAAAATHLRLDGRVAIVTGASRGIGRALALALAGRGARVVIAARSVESRPGLPGSIYSVAEEVAAIGGTALPARVDVSREEDVRRMVDLTMERFGQIDILVSNASALWWQPILKTAPRRFEEMLLISLKGAYHCLYFALPHMVARRWGHVICVSPPLGDTPRAGRGVFAAVKAGVSRLALTAADEHRADNIAVNTLWTYLYVETQATINWALGDRSSWLSPDFVCDAALEMLAEDPGAFSGRQLVAEDLLRERGWTSADLASYVVGSRA